jgi:hypothetical protein
MVESDILRPRTIAHPWAIVRKSPFKSAKHTEEANVRPPLSDRLLPRQAHVRPQPAPAPTLECERSPSRETVSHDLFRSLFPFFPSLLQQCLHLIVSWLEDQHLFQDMGFWIQVWGYDIPTSAHSGTPIPLTSFFSFVHTLETMYDSSLGV